MPTDLSYSLDELVEQVNHWCAAHRLAPANGQSAEELSTRTLRYYRTLGLLAAPSSGAGHGYGELHRLQLCAVRVLQAQGLPLRRIQALLYGRTEAELRKVLDKGVAAAPAREPGLALPEGEDWRVLPVDATAWLILREGRRLSALQLSPPARRPRRRICRRAAIPARNQARNEKRNEKEFMNPVPPRGLRPVPSDPFGLIAWLEETRVVLPLKAVDVTFNAAGDLAEVSLDQVFHQTAPRPLDVLYTFPLPAGAAVFRCELIVNDRVIAARVEEQERAREIARQMKAEGRRTGLVEMERDNLFTLSLGNVQPGDLVIVRFAWFQVLDHALDQKSLAIPFTPGLRYIPGRPLLRANRGAGAEDDTDQVSDASRISPPRIDQLHPDAALVSITGTIDPRFADAASVSSATHPVLVRETGEALHVTLPLEGHVPDPRFHRALEGTRHHRARPQAALLRRRRRAVRRRPPRRAPPPRRSPRRSPRSRRTTTTSSSTAPAA
ncbi:MAG: VIT domain-containing protein [Verrucomicrobiota bacterium]